MRCSLYPHPAFPPRAVQSVEVELSRPESDRLALRYLVAGDLSGLRLPQLAAPARSDRLWEHSCFEIFARSSADGSYYEFNFSPSSEWAAYRLSGYRAGMTVPPEIGPPQIEMRAKDEGLELSVALELSGDRAWQLGLSVILEEMDGRKSFWALAHPPGKPDFHHSDCFALELPAAKKP